MCVWLDKIKNDAHSGKKGEDPSFGAFFWSVRLLKSVSVNIKSVGGLAQFWSESRCWVSKGA